DVVDAAVADRAIASWEIDGGYIPTLDLPHQRSLLDVVRLGWKDKRRPAPRRVVWGRQLRDLLRDLGEHLPVVVFVLRLRPHLRGHQLSDADHGAVRMVGAGSCDALRAAGVRRLRVDFILRIGSSWLGRAYDQHECGHQEDGRSCNRRSQSLPKKMAPYV